MIVLTGIKTEAAPPPVVTALKRANGQSFNDAAVNTLSLVEHSLTLSVATDSPNPVEVSFDSGATWTLVVEQGGTRTWDSSWRNSNERLQIELIAFRGITGATAKYDLVGD